MSNVTCQQTLKLVENGITGLCACCLNRPGCADAVATEFIDKLMAPGVHRVYLFSRCDNYTADPKRKDAPLTGDLEPELFQAGITDRCCACPPSVKSDCGTRYQLDRLTAASIARSGFLQARMVCCNQAERLYQISEPSVK